MQDIAKTDRNFTMNVLIVDDHNLFRSGLRFLLSDLDESIQFFEADGVESLISFADARIDLTLLDMHLRGNSGTDALIEVRKRLPESTVVVLSSEENPALIRECIESGAAGFIPKASTPEVLVHALKLVLAGGLYLPPHVMAARFESRDPGHRASDVPATSSDKIKARMSPRQLAALMLAIQGKSNKAIAQELGVVEGTVKLHLSGAFRALGVSNRTEAVFAAAQCGLFTPRT